MTDLLADIGGTNARVAFRRQGHINDKIYLRRTRDFPGIAVLLKDVVAEAGLRPVRAAIAVAGPVTADEIKLTNLPWAFSRTALAAELGVETLRIENDVAAIAWSVPGLGKDDMVTVKAGTAAPDAPRVVIAPGTGLGMAGIMPDGDRWHVIASEGGHAYAGPSPAISDKDRMVAWAAGPGCAWEDLTSGQGLLDLYRRAAPVTAAADPPEVTALAKSGDAHALRAVDIFTRLLGACAGDMTLILGARGGCYIAGGVVPALGDLFRADAFVAGFTGKGRFADYLAPVPVYLMKDSYAGLTGLSVLLDQRS